MWAGVVVSIYVAPAAGAPMVAVDEARAVPERGLEGDRYFHRAGRWSRQAGTGRALTLIEDEALEALLDEAGIELPPGASRRNVVTRGVPLNHLVNRDFRIGGVTLRGMRLCEPCNYLERLTEQAGVRRTLVHRGGLRAEILTEGIIRVGDSVCEELEGPVGPCQADVYDLQVSEARRGEPTVPWEELKAELEADLTERDEGDTDGEHLHRHL